MSRSIALDADGIRIRYGGLDRALTLKHELVIPYQAIEDVTIGLADAPSPWTLQRVGLSDPVTGTRRGRFRTGGKRWFLDLRNPERALALHLKPGYDFDVVAIESDHPQSLLDAIVNARRR